MEKMWKMLTNRLPLDLIIVTVIICIAWSLFQAINDTKWSAYRNIITPLYCIYLDTLDQIAHSIALWHIVAVELYRTVLYSLSPQNSPKWAY
jgi:hypothetical protein